MESIRVAMETPSGLPDEKLPMGAPMYVGINVPFELIDMAKRYPAIDWDEVMRYAVENFDEHRASQPEGRLADIAVEFDQRPCRIDSSINSGYCYNHSTLLDICKRQRGDCAAQVTDTAREGK